MQQLLDKEVFIGVQYNNLSKEQKKKIIRSHLFLKEKFLSNGSFDKLKSRFVAGGDMQDKTLYDDVSSPTASLTSVFITSLIAAHEKRHVVTADIAGAYLNASIDTQEVLMRIDPLMSAIICKLDPSFIPFLSDKGSLVVQLKKALYGCIESAQLWYNHLTTTLMNYGYTINEHDICVMNKEIDGQQITVVIYVDDLMITSTNKSHIDDLLSYLTEQYKSITINDGVIHSYLGMSLDFSNDKQVKITMAGYINELLKQHYVEGITTTPANLNLFKINTNSKSLNNNERENFHSIVAKLLYLAKRVRADILVSTIFLTTRVNNPTEEDWSKLERILKYLNGTRDIGIILSAVHGINIFAYVDAAFGCHSDYKGHTGGFISLGQGPVHVKSSKQKLVTKSSTESELVGLSDYASQVIWTYYFLQSQGYNLEDPAIVYQDNKSAMALMALINKGHSTSERTRHINIRYFFLKDRIDKNEIKIEFVSTKNMIADFKT
jgi:histone deacetylase 1/2